MKTYTLIRKPAYTGSNVPLERVPAKGWTYHCPCPSCGKEGFLVASPLRFYCHRCDMTLQLTHFIHVRWNEHREFLPTGNQCHHALQRAWRCYEKPAASN